MAEKKQMEFSIMEEIEGRRIALARVLIVFGKGSTPCRRIKGDTIKSGIRLHSDQSFSHYPGLSPMLSAIALHDYSLVPERIQNLADKFLHEEAEEFLKRSRRGISEVEKWLQTRK